MSETTPPETLPSPKAYGPAHELRFVTVQRIQAKIRASKPKPKPAAIAAPSTLTPASMTKPAKPGAITGHGKRS